MTTIILCGGSGTRLWPLSRAAMPKQFASIVPGGSLFEGAVQRNLEAGSAFVIAANESQQAIAAAQLAGLGVSSYLSMVEPTGRNTAPAIALAALMLPPEEVVFVAPSDHLIRGLAEYRAILARGADLARAGRLVTFGIAPAYAETGYGYIETDGETVLSFKEKPDAPTAQRYLDAGRYLWNSGMFCFTAGAFLAELKTHAPDIHATCLRAYERSPSKNPLRPAKDDMLAIPSISVDYAVMEKSANVSCVRCGPELGWSDLGSYDALYDELAKENARGTHIGTLEPLAIHSSRNLVFAGASPSGGSPTGASRTGGKRIVLVDVQDLVVIDTPDALLVTRRGSTQKVKDAVEALKTLDPELL